MLALTSAHRYLLRKAPTDMRKGFDTLCGLVRDEMGRDPLSGEVYVFASAIAQHIASAVGATGSRSCSTSTAAS